MNPTTKTPSSFSILKESFDYLINNITRLWFVLFVPPTLLAVWELLPESGETVLPKLVLSLANAIISTLSYVALIYMLNNETADVKSAYKSALKLLIPLLLASLLVGSITLVGIMLLIIPGIYFAIKYSFTSYIVITENVGVWEAFSRSGKYTQGYKIDLLLKMFFSFGVGFLVVFVLGLASGLTGLTTSKEFSSPLTNLLINALLSPLFTIFYFKVYNYIKAANPVDPNSPKAKAKWWIILVAILAIFGILGTIGATGYMLFKNSGELTAKSRDASRKASITLINNAIMAYKATNLGKAPGSLQELAPEYMGKVPVDPSDSSSYEYTVNGDDYKICAQLESKEKFCKP